MKKRCSFFWGLILLLVYFTAAGRFAFLEAKAASVSLVRGEELFYEGYSTFYYYIDGKLGYCLEPKKSSPHAGEFAAEQLNNDTLLSKALYYVYGGPGYEQYMKPVLTSEWTEQKKAYCLSHCILSYIYDDCSDNSDAFTGLSQQMRLQVIACADKIRSFPAIPEPGLTFSDSNASAYFSEEEGVQRTEEITCIGDAANYLELNLPEGVTLVNVTKETKSQGKVKIYGADSFYFSADAGAYNEEMWESGEVYSVNRQRWRSLVISTGSDGQHLGTGMLVTAETAPASISVQWIPKPDLHVDKQADKANKTFKAGDVITYSVDITQQIERAVAKNVVITDTILTDGVKLQKNSIVLLDENQSIVSGAIISVHGNSYTIQTNKFLKAIETGEKYTVEYQVVITDASVIGKEIKNEVVVRAENAVEKKDEETVIVETPEEPEEPQKPEVPELEPKEPQPEVTVTQKAGFVKTGDEQNLMVLTVLLILSCAGIFICGKIARKTK